MVGKSIHELPTPALVVDLDIMEGNLKRMAELFQGNTCKLRPHFKNIKCIKLAQLQMDAGAIGITCATVRETELLVQAGIKSILVANEVAGEANLKLLLGLTLQSKIFIAVDNAIVVEEIARLCKGTKYNPILVVDLDLGLKRCGTKPGQPALDLARKILAVGLHFGGLMGYEGHLQRLKLGDASLAVRRQALNELVATKDLLESNGIAVEIVSTGGTGTSAIAGSMKGITEVQPGNYLLMDTSYAPFAADFLPALTLLTTVISIAPGERFILNAGIKEISAERGLPTLRNMPGAILTALHAEHGIVDIKDSSLTITVGDQIPLDVYYSDGTVNLHRKMYGVRHGKVEIVYSIAS